MGAIIPPVFWPYLTQVTMVRGNIKQNRYFSYNGSNLVSATNPENGTVTYTYDNFATSQAPAVVGGCWAEDSRAAPKTAWGA